jgi:hypothetical protein
MSDLVRTPDSRPTSCSPPRSSRASQFARRIPALPRFNWLILPDRAMGALSCGQHPARVNMRGLPSWLPYVMPEIEITEECRILILIVGAPAPFRQPERRLSNGNWQIPIDAETRQRLEKLRRQGESISDCIIRLIIITQYKRGLF